MDHATIFGIIVILFLGLILYELRRLNDGLRRIRTNQPDPTRGP